MSINLRPVQPADTEICGQIIYKAFAGINAQHNFAPDFLSTEQTHGFAQMLTAMPGIYGVAAENDGGEFVGSNFLWEAGEIVGVGPITVNPDAQAKGAGRLLMQDVIERGKNAKGIRLVQSAFNIVSMSLYASLGFDIKEPLVVIEGGVSGELPANMIVRPLEEKDFAACDELCIKIQGFSRLAEIKQFAQMLKGFVVERAGKIVGYATSPNSWQLNHAVAETETDMEALLMGAGNLSGQPLSFLLPTRNGELFRWCLSKGMRVVKPLSLMAMGEYQEPRGAFLPSVLY